MTTQNLEMVSGDAVVLEITIVDETDGTAVDLSGCSGTFVVARANSRRLLITKTSASGVTVSDATAGRIDVELDASDTNSKAGSYEYELQIVDSAGNRSTPLDGTLTIKRDLIET